MVSYVVLLFVCVCVCVLIFWVFGYYSPNFCRIYSSNLNIVLCYKVVWYVL